MTYDYLIVGQGVAGSFLAWSLIKRGKKVVVLDNDHKNSSSMISAGIINPVTGKRFAITEDFDVFYDYAVHVYRELEQTFQEKFFESIPIIRFFKNEEEFAKWNRKEERGIAASYAGDCYPPHTFAPLIDDSLGSIRIVKGGFCRTQQLLKAFRQYFLDQTALRSANVSYEDIQLTGQGVEYCGDQFKAVLFCEGYQAQFNPWFHWLPFNSVKGEILRLRMKGGALPEAILNKGKWCVPSGHDEWIAGASYIWNDLDCHPTEEGKQDVLEGLKSIRVPKEITDHQAAVRPVMKDQKPVLGMHPQHAQIGLLNGLGSKGFLTAPYYADHLAEALVGKGTIGADVSLERFWPSPSRACGPPPPRGWNDLL